jgi:uncharacterized membrane protein SirB2
MTINLFLLIIWVINGILTFISAAISEDHKVHVFSFAMCWVALIILLVEQL